MKKLSPDRLAKLLFLLLLSIIFLTIIISNRIISQREILQTQAKSIKKKSSELKKVSMTCSFPDPIDNKSTITAYIKGSYIKMDGLRLGKNSKGMLLIKINQAWIWENQSKKGLTFSFIRNDQAKKKYIVIYDNPQGKVNQLLDMIENELLNYCKEDSKIKNTRFSLPSEVVFKKV